jgi:hypothetical protein
MNSENTHCKFIVGNLPDILHQSLHTPFLVTAVRQHIERHFQFALESGSLHFNSLCYS